MQPPATMGGHPGVLQHDCVVVVLMHDVECVDHLEGRRCEFGYENQNLGDKNVSFADKTKT